MKSVEQAIARDLSRRAPYERELGRAVLGWAGEVTGGHAEGSSKLERRGARVRRGQLVKGAFRGKG